ncbi:transposase [Photobacterium profundum]|uniref:transposase n=1 Tax=Photobacterium profundum TaxID=74109 RepID=UPI0012F4CA7D
MQCVALSTTLIKDFACRAKNIGETIGFTSVLHTHNRRRDLHPQIYIVVTGDGFDTNKRQWIHCKNQYLLNAFALANVWRARLLSHITDTLKLRLPRQLSPKWVVDCRHVGRGKSALLYLSKYLYRGVLVLSLLPPFNAVSWRISTEIILGYIKIIVQLLFDEITRIKH